MSTLSSIIKTDLSWYRCPTLQDGFIRLLRILPSSTIEDIRCALETYPLDDDLVYTALSYCWGDIGSVKSIQLECCKVWITTNLWTALSSFIEHHTYSNSELFWIDALCIDQSNIEERNHQVHRMWQIFSSARKVLCWVGLEDEYMAQAFSTIENIARSCEADDPFACAGWKKHHLSVSDDDLIALQSLTMRDYFSRTWVIQEFVQAPYVVLRCGRYSTVGSCLGHLQRLCLGSYAGELIHIRYLHRSAAFAPKGILEAFTMLANTFYTYALSHCTDPRDRIFAFLGDRAVRMLGPGTRLLPDYAMELPELALSVAAYFDSMLDVWSARLGNDDYLSPADQESHVEGLVRSIRTALYLPLRVKGVGCVDFEVQLGSRLLTSCLQNNGPVVTLLLHVITMEASIIAKTDHEASFIDSSDQPR